MTSAEQRQPKLNMNGGSFSERLVRFENELSGLLTALDSSRLNEHTRLALGAPWGLGDEAHFEEPAVFSLLAYGLPGITALESIASLAETDVTSAGVHPALRALATAALGLGEYAASSVWLAHRYPSLDDSAFELLEAAVRATCASGDARARAD